MTFAGGLRAIMRLDPDVILVGEIRDHETARMATQAALTGHLVLSSIHANDAVGVLFRLLDLGVEPFLISSALVGAISQRMVRRVCPRCRSLSEVPAEERQAYEVELGEAPEKLYYGAGCNFCANTGYLGRTGVFEVLTLSEEFRAHAPARRKLWRNESPGHERRHDPPATGRHAEGPAGRHNAARGDQKHLHHRLDRRGQLGLQIRRLHTVG